MIDTLPLCDGELDLKPETIELTRITDRRMVPAGGVIANGANVSADATGRAVAPGQLVGCLSCKQHFLAMGPYRSRPVVPSMN